MPRRLRELLGRESEKPRALGKNLGGPLQSLGNVLSEGLDNLASAMPDIKLPDLPQIGSTQRAPTEIGRIRYESRTKVMGIIEDIEEKLPSGAPSLTKALQDLKLPELPELPGQKAKQSYDRLGFEPPSFRGTAGGKRVVYE